MGKIKLAESKFRQALRGKGLYITLTACIVAAAGAGYFAYDKAIDKINDDISLSVPDESTAAPAMNDASQVDKTPSKPDVIQTITDAKQAVMPVNGAVLTDYSNGELVKSETLGVWKTHDGVDIAADVGTDVKAMNDGTVSDVWEDPLWGVCVSISHSGDVVSYYYNLSDAVAVKEGDTVTGGQVIGTVGTSAQCEIKLQSHLHFAVKKNGAWTDPVEFVNPGAEK
ncbi:MAG: M23 family metallopeptidase [Oscillospiraceae bacterium]